MEQIAAKEVVYGLLKEHHIPFEVQDHPPAYTVEDIVSFHLPRPESGARNLFVRDDKKRHYCLLTVKDDTPVSIKAFQERAGLRRLSFASEADLMTYLSLTRGAVTPFGLLNDATHAVKLYLDSWFRGREISVHPNDNTATVYLQTEDLVRLIEAHGNEVEYFDFDDLAKS